MNILQKTLKAIGAKDIRDLSPQEKETYNEYQELMEREVTIDDLKKMLPALRKGLEDRLLEHDNTAETDMFLKARLRNLKDIELFITAPERNKAALETNLKNLINHK